METINPYYHVLLPVAVLGAVWFLYSRWSTQQKLRRLASDLGLTFSTSGSDVLGLPGRENTEQAGQAPSSGTFLELLFNWQLSGRMNGIRVSARRVFEKSQFSSGPRKYTSFQAFFDEPKSLGLQLHQRLDPGLVMRMMSKISGNELSEIQTGNKPFDRKMVLKGRQVEAIRALFGNPSLQEQILSYIEAGDSFVVDDKGAHAVRGQRFSDPESIRALLDRLAGIVRLVQSAG